jgi:uncharacterized protein (DUF1499 family)
MTASSPREPRWPGRLTRSAIAITILAILLLAIAGPGYRMGLLPLLPALLGAAAGFVLFMLGFVVGAVGLLGARRGRRSTSRIAWTLVVLAGVASVVAGVWINRLRSAPPIHDITTDVDEPPQFKALVPVRAAAQAANPPDYQRIQTVGGASLDIGAAQTRAYPAVRPLDLAQPPEQALQLADQAARNMGWQVVAVVPGDGRMEATDTTLYFGFADDVVVRVRPVPSGSRVDVRSESRVGLGDAGTNARRIVKFLAELRQLASAPGKV